MLNPVIKGRIKYQPFGALKQTSPLIPETFPLSKKVVPALRGIETFEYLLALYTQKSVRKSDQPFGALKLRNPTARKFQLV